MASRKRARLTEENDPLTQTDQVLVGFEQVSKSARQKVNKSASQSYEKSASQEVNNLASQPDEKSISQANGKLASQEVSNPTSQPSEKLSCQEVGLLASQEVSKLDSQQVNESIEQKTKRSARSQKPTSQQVSQLTSQPVNKPTIRKATFQISEEVLGCLETFHLKLQLELGKGNAPYKEVIVEEAISRFLTQVEDDREEAIDSLQERQIKRD